MPIRITRGVGGMRGVSGSLRRGFKERTAPRRVTTRVGSGSPRFMGRVLSCLRGPISLRAPMKRSKRGGLNSVIRSGSTAAPRSTVGRLIRGRRMRRLLRSLGSERHRIVHLEFNLRSKGARALRRVNSRLGIAERHMHRVRTETVRGLHDGTAGLWGVSFRWVLGGYE